MRTRIKYGILDDFDEVIFWQWDKPENGRKFVIRYVLEKHRIDWNNFEEAPF